MDFLRLQNTPINLLCRKVFWSTAFLILCVITLFLLWRAAPSTAQTSTTFSGRLIDTEGKPISHIRIYMRSRKDPNHEKSETSDDSLQTVTDPKGRFAFSGIVYDALQLDIANDSKTGYEINVLSVEFGELAFYPNRSWHWSSLNFSLDPGVKMENVIITAAVRTRPKIRTRIVYADGTPLANTRIYAYRQTNRFFSDGGGTHQLIEQTDAEGYMTEYLFTTEQPEYYITLAVEHQGLFAKAVPFILEDDADLVLTLNDNPNLPMQRLLGHSERVSALAAYLEPQPIWIVNPANGHAYKSTQSQTIKDAIAQATAEDAYLVAINDEAEEKWLQHVFGNDRFWIGLSDVEEEGKWKWHSGEPVNYTRWGTYESEGGNTDAKDYVMTLHFGWGWEACEEIYQAGSSQNSQPHRAEAILEKGTAPLRAPSDKN